MSVRPLLIATTLAAISIAPLAGASLAQTPAISIPSSAPAPVTDMFYTGAWAPNHWRASEAVGQPVYNRVSEKIGEVEELLIDAEGRILAAVVGVGGFLGIGERHVAVSYRSFQMTRDDKGKPRLMVNLDKATLENAPVYKSSDTAKRS